MPDLTGMIHSLSLSHVHGLCLGAEEDPMNIMSD